MAINQQLVEEIIRRVLTKSNPKRIILFGSAATGQMNRDSDIDLLVVEPTPGDTREKSVRIGDQGHHRRDRLSGQQLRQGYL